SLKIPERWFETLDRNKILLRNRPRLPSPRIPKSQRIAFPFQLREELRTAFDVQPCQGLHADFALVCEPNDDHVQTRRQRSRSANNGRQNRHDRSSVTGTDLTFSAAYVSIWGMWSFVRRLRFGHGCLGFSARQISK